MPQEQMSFLRRTREAPAMKERQREESIWKAQRKPWYGLRESPAVGKMPLEAAIEAEQKMSLQQGTEGLAMMGRAEKGAMPEEQRSPLEGMREAEAMTETHPTSPMSKVRQGISRQKGARHERSHFRRKECFYGVIVVVVFFDSTVGVVFFDEVDGIRGACLSWSRGLRQLHEMEKPSCDGAVLAGGGKVAALARSG